MSKEKMKKKFGIVSYNMYCNFTNYGSALQSWALQQAIDRVGKDYCESVIVDYCPDVLRDKDTLNPMKNMWDTDEESRKMCELSLPAIRINYDKFSEFYKKHYNKTEGKYTSENFEEIVEKEDIRNFVCGSDTIFCINEFKGFDDGYYANYKCMKEGYSVAYVASFGDVHFEKEDYPMLNERLSNFKAIGLRENKMLEYVENNTKVPVKKVIDPTLLLKTEDYEEIVAERQEKEKYLLLYARRYSPRMEEYAEKLAQENGWKIVEISLRAINSSKHRMFYEAGVEEFLSLVKYAECIVTNSFHGMIFSVQFCKPFYIFSREQCDNKILEMLKLFGINDRLLVDGTEEKAQEIDYEMVHKNIESARKESLEFLRTELMQLG